jgi:hypothetical protein
MEILAAYLSKLHPPYPYRSHKGTLRLAMEEDLGEKGVGATAEVVVQVAEWAVVTGEREAEVG